MTKIIYCAYIIKKLFSYAKRRLSINHGPWYCMVLKCNKIYYTHTEKYLPKSYVVNFVRKLVLANQRSERWFSHVKNMIRLIRIANDVFSRVRKMIRPIRSHRGVWVSRQNSRLLLQLAAPLRTFSTRKDLLKEFFSLKKWKTVKITYSSWITLYPHRHLCF